MTHRSICLSTSWRRTAGGIRAQTSSGPNGALSSSVAPWTGRLDDLRLAQQPELVAGDEVGVLDQVGRADRLRPEAEVRDRDRAGLLGVVDEVALGVEPGVLADDLHRRLVRADRAVAAEAEEHGGDLARGRLAPERAVDREAEAGDVVDDADREVRLRPWRGQLVVDGLDHRRRQLLGRQPVAAADDPRQALERRLVAGHRLVHRGDDLEVQRLADRARLLRAVEDRDRADGLRQRGEQRLGRERLEQADLEHAHALPARDERLDGLLDRAAGRADHDDHPVRVRRAVVVDEVVLAAGALGELVEHRPARSRAPRRGTGSRPRGPGRRRPGSGRCRGRRARPA